MKKNVLMRSKRMAAFALSLSMILSEGALVNAAQVDAVQADVEAEALETELEAVQGTEAEQEDADAGIALTSEEDGLPVEEADSVDELALEEETEEKLSDAKGAAVKPGTVGNLRFETRDEDDGILDKSRLSWNTVQGADEYEIRITGADGAEYGDYWQHDDESTEFPYYSTRSLSYDLDNLIGAYAYQKTADGTAYERVVPYNMVSRGGSYTISVRAVTSNVAGDWSEAVTYTMPAVTTAEIPSNVKLEVEKDGAYITYTEGEEDNSGVQVEVKDSQGREYTNGWSLINGVWTQRYVTTWGRLNVSEINSQFSVWEPKTDATGAVHYEQVLADGKAITAFQVGETYTIRLRGMNTTGTETTYSDWSAPITYTVASFDKEVEVPEATGNVKYNASSKNVTWNLSKGREGYEVELTEAGQAPVTRNTYDYYYSRYDDDDDYYYGYQRYSQETLPIQYDYMKNEAGGYSRVDLVNLKPATSYTIRVRAYNTKKDGTKQYSDWTEAYAFTTVVEETPLEKVTGLKVSESGISWKEAKDTAKVSGYEVEIVDADGRVYTEEPTKNSAGVWEINNCFTSRTSISKSKLENLYTYVPVYDTDGTVLKYKEFKYASSNSSIAAFGIPGKTYTVQVRAYKMVRDANGNETKILGDWSDKVSYTTELHVGSGSDLGVKSAPAKVSGLVLKTEDKEHPVYEPTLRWNSIENVDHYEFEIKDSKGNSYTYRWEYKNQEYVIKYYQTGGNNNNIGVSNLEDLFSYVKNEGSALAKVQNAAGEDAKTFEAGETYTIRVRAVNKYEAWNADKGKHDDPEYFNGAWSNAVTYKPGASTALTGLKYVRSDKNKYYFTYKAVVDHSTIYYQIATDDKFNSASKVTGWSDYYAGQDLLVISETEEGLEKGKTYYIRAVNYPNNSKKDFYDLTEAEIQALNPSVTTFTTEAAKGPKNITGLKLYKETEDGYEFRFNAVLKDEDEDEYELQYTQDQNSDNWYSAGKTTKIFRSQINEGTTYVRAVAYVEQLNESTGKEEKVYGAPSNIVTITKNRSTSTISKLKLSKKMNNGVSFTFSGTVRKGQFVKVQYSDSKNFADNKEYDIDVNWLSSEEKVNKEFTLYYEDLTPGKKYYVRARVENTDAKSQAEEKSAYTNVVSFSTVIPQISAGVSSVTKNSITLHADADNNDKYLTGYEIQRKNGKKWDDVVKTTDSTYTDKKLKKDTTYSYRVRPYFYNQKTKKTTNGTWVYTEGTTWGAALNLTAKAASKTSIKLSWSKVSGAKGYEVYRKLGSSDTTQISNGKGNGFTQYKLVKTSGEKSTSYTDKGLTQGMEYSYIVRAYKTLDGKKVTISESAGASLAWELSTISWVQQSNGKVKWTWNPVYSAKGYLVEKQDNVTGKWSTYKKIKKAKTNSITLPKTSDQNGVTYRVRAYNGTKYTEVTYGDTQRTVYPVLAAPTSVKAKASAKGDSITITWKKVKGADYYRVYRTTDSSVVYDKDQKGYSADAERIDMYVADSSKVTGYRLVEDPKDLNITKIVDKDITYTRNGVTTILQEGPKTGVTYYYYVVAYKKAKAYEYADVNTDVDAYGEPTDSQFSKPAKATIKPAAPKKVTLSSVKAAKNKVTVKYKKVKGVDGYDIFRSTNSKKGFEVVGTVTGDSKLSYVDKKSKSNELKKGKKYYYKVQAFTYDEAGQKVYGKASSVKNVKAK